MLQGLLTWLLKSQGAKTAGAALTGSTISVAVLIGILEKNVDQKIENMNTRVIHYVDIRHNMVSSDIRNIKEDQIEIKELLKIINQRVYQLNQNHRGN